MKKSLILCLFISTLFIPIAKAATCYPTASWKLDSQFFIGETSKLIITLNNPCDKIIDVTTEVKTEKTYGYIKVYPVPSELEKPTPKPHDINTGSPMVSVELDRSGTKDSQKKVVYYIQPDELTPLGTYTLVENFYVEGELKDTKEVSITVRKPLQITYSLPTSMKFGTPSTASISIANNGFEFLNSLKICVSSPENIVSFSESCKTWTNIPSRYTDKFNFMVNSLVPGEYKDSIKVDIYYTTYTGLNLHDSYYHPSLKITTTQATTPTSSQPYLSYSLIRGIGNLTLQITNKGNSTAYRCIATLTSSPDISLSPSNLISSSKSEEGNTYEIDCGSEIQVKKSSSIVLTFDPAEITSSSVVRGMISYRDSKGEVIQTDVKDIYLQTTTTTVKPIIPTKDEKNISYIVLLVIVVVVIGVVVFLKYKKPEMYKKLVESLKRFFGKIGKTSKRPEQEKIEEK